MKVYEGAILTCDANGRAARFLVEDKGRILHVGESLPAQYESAAKISLGERALCPAFGDTHIHFMSYALFSGGLDVRNCASNREISERVSAWAAKSKEKIILGFGASPHSVAERTMISRAELDEACPDRPVFLVKYDGHASVANSKLLSMLPPSVPLQRGYDSSSGLLTQEAFFRSTDFVTGTVSLADTLVRMVRAADSLASRGIALIHSVTGVGFPLDLDVTLESIFARGLPNGMAYRIFFQTQDVAKALKRKLPRIGGCFACALDGCFGSADAALLEPYAGDWERTAGTGVLYFTDEQVTDFAVRANRAGLQIQLHAIGDRAFLQAARAIAAALADSPRRDHRHTIIHACLAQEEALDICVRCGIALAVQPTFIHWKAEPLSYLEEILGPRAASLNPLKTMIDRGIMLTGGSDGPCTESNPLAAIEAAATHYNAGEAVTVQQALNMFTRNAAWGTFDEAERGSLEPGKRADMVILDRNILAIPTHEISKTKVEALLIAGKPYRNIVGTKAGKTAADTLALAGTILRGLLSRRKI